MFLLGAAAGAKRCPAPIGTLPHLSFRTEYNPAGGILWEYFSVFWL
jgi:hypothetical protein